MTLEHFKRLELLKTFHNHICKEQSKDSFYNDFVLQSRINILGLFWVQSKRKSGQKKLRKNLKPWAGKF